MSETWDLMASTVRRLREFEDWRLVRADADGTLVFDCYRYGRRYVMTAKLSKIEDSIV